MNFACQLTSMFVKKELNQFTILRLSKISTSLAVVFLGRFGDLSFVFPISFFIMLHVFWHHVCIYIFFLSNFFSYNFSLGFQKVFRV